MTHQYRRARQDRYRLRPRRLRTVLWQAAQGHCRLIDEVDLVSYDETEPIQSLLERHRICALSPLQIRRVLADAGSSSRAANSIPESSWGSESLATSAAEASASWPMEDTVYSTDSKLLPQGESSDAAWPMDGETLATPCPSETRLLHAIQKHCNTVDVMTKLEPGSTNRLVLQQFGKSRETMTVTELLESWVWLLQNHPKPRDLGSQGRNGTWRRRCGRQIAAKGNLC